VSGNTWTAGPWRAVCGKAITLVTRDKQDKNDTTGNVQICFIAGAKDADIREFNGPRWEADARLIAAAPEMAEALEALMEVANTPDRLSAPAAWHRARALLSRIRGDAP